MSTTTSPAAAAPPAGPATEAGPTTEDLLAALPGELGPIRRSRAFRFRLAICSVTLLALLVVYVALLAATSYGLWSHFASGRFVDAVHQLLPWPVAYIFACIAGPILFVFLVKPLFTLGIDRPACVRLDRAAEPRLFAFVDRLCAAQGAPVPREILVDTQANASASLRHGLVGLFRDDLTLTIGLTLARGLTLREFAGVLAHEFGHFAQGGAMRLTSLIRRSVHVMQRVAHERDGFDQALYDAGRIRLFLDPRLLILSLIFALFIWATIGFLWLARMLLRGLAWVGMVATGALMRQMEYEADRHEARLVGRATFVEVGDRLLLLNAARQAAVAVEQRSYAARRLPEDLPGLVALLADRIAARPEIVDRLRDEAMKATTGRFDTHPAQRDRVAAVQGEADAGLIRLEAPASVLFADLPALSREASLAFYREQLDMEFGAVGFLPVSEILHEVEGDPDIARRAARLTQGCPPDALRLAIGPDPGAAPPTAQDLDLARRLVLELAPGAIEAAGRLDEARQRLDHCGAAAALHRAEFPVDPGLIGAAEVTRESLAEERRQAGEAIAAAEGGLAPYSEAVGRRVRAALGLGPIAGPAVGEADPGACAMLVAALDGLGRVRPDAEALRSRLATLRIIVGVANGDAGNPLAVRPAYEASDDAWKAIQSLRAVVDGFVYPFPMPLREVDRHQARPTVGLFLGPSAFERDPGGVHSQGMDLLSRLRGLEDRILSALAERVEQVERALGLPPLPDPPAEAVGPQSS